MHSAPSPAAAARLEAGRPGRPWPPLAPRRRALEDGPGGCGGLAGPPPLCCSAHHLRHEAAAAFLVIANNIVIPHCANANCGTLRRAAARGRQQGEGVRNNRATTPRSSGSCSARGRLSAATATSSPVRITTTPSTSSPGRRKGACGLAEKGLLIMYTGSGPDCDRKLVAAQRDARGARCTQPACAAFSMRAFALPVLLFRPPAPNFLSFFPFFSATFRVPAAGRHLKEPVCRTETDFSMPVSGGNSTLALSLFGPLAHLPQMAAAAAQPRSALLEINFLL